MDDTYRVSAVDEDGLASPADVTTSFGPCSPPELEIAGGRHHTARGGCHRGADDDFGLERFELVYAVIGQA